MIFFARNLALLASLLSGTGGSGHCTCATAQGQHLNHVYASQVHVLGFDSPAPLPSRPSLEIVSVSENGIDEEDNDGPESLTSDSLSGMDLGWGISSLLTSLSPRAHREATRRSLSRIMRC